MKTIFDFETRSPIDLKARGLFPYASDPFTEIMCCGFAIDNDHAVVWVKDYFLDKIDPKKIRYQIIDDAQAVEIIRESKELVAQNSIFEYAIHHKIAVPRMGWPKIPMTKMHDTRAQLGYHALPLNLEQAALALNLPFKKDAAGHSVMLKLCKPRKPRKDEEPNALLWHEDPADLETLINYCGRDVEVERMVHERLAPLPPREREIWLLDQKINLRGIRIDVENVTAIVNTLKAHEDRLLDRFQKATGGAVSGPRSYSALKDWVNEQTGLNLVSVDKEATLELLEKPDLKPTVREALSIKSELSKSSTAKFRAMLDRMSEDGRVRDWSVYHAASTGRWAAWGLQLHNNPRDSYGPADYESVCERFREGDIEGLRLLWDDPYFVASRCVRGALAAAPGNELICTDFSAIEGRGLAYLAGEKWVLDAYAAGEDLYKFAAADLFDVEYGEVAKPQRQIGKVEELFLGYGGGIGAFQTGAKSYNIDLETLPDLVAPRTTRDELDGHYGAVSLAKIYLSKNPGAMSLRAAIACDVIKRKWRAARPHIVAFWKQLNEAALLAIQSPGQIFAVNGKLRFCVHDDFLKCQLPSGRVLHYYKPKISIEATEWGESTSISYMGMRIIEGKTVRQWARIFTHGGKLSENVTQAFCRDLLAEAMLRHEAAGYPICLHVHDEDMAELPVGNGDLAEFNRIAEIVPSWAAGMPIKAEGWVGKRYRKD